MLSIVNMFRTLHLLSRPFFQQLRSLPKPGKTSRAALKRFTPATGPYDKGLIYRSQQGASHFNTKKDNSRRTRLKRPALVSKADQRRIRRLFGRGGM